MVRRNLLVIPIVLAVIGGWLLWDHGSTPSSPPEPRDVSGQTDSERHDSGAPALTLEGMAEAAPSSASPPQEDHGEPTAEGEMILALGRVVDEARRPVAGATVVVSFDGVKATRAHSNDIGAFDVPLGVRPAMGRAGELRVRSGVRGADRRVWLGPDSPNPTVYGPIGIRPLKALTVRVSRDGKPSRGAEVALRDMEAGRPAAIAASGRTTRDGIVRFSGLTASKIGVFAVAKGTGRAFEQVVLPTDGIVDIELPADRRATIQVVRAPGNEPVEGAEVHLSGAGTNAPPSGIGCLPPLPPARTDVDGRVVLSGLPQGYLSVVARAPGWAMRYEGLGLERVTLEPEQDKATVTLHAYRTLRFPIRDLENAPPEGTCLRVRRYQPKPGYDVGHPEGRIEDGHLVLEPFPPGFDWGHVVSPDGLWASWRAPPDEDLGDPVDFRPLRDVRVRLLWREGAPAAGQILSAQLLPRGRKPSVRTDADGRAFFPACTAESVLVWWSPAEGGRGIPIATVSLTSDPGTVEIRIGRPIEIAVGISVGGVAGLPAEYAVRAPYRDPQSGRRRTRRVAGQFIEEDPDPSEIRFTWLPYLDGEPLTVEVGVEGLPDAMTPLVQDASGVWRGAVDFQASTTLRARIDGPEDLRYWLVVERWNEEHGSFEGLHFDPVYRAGLRAVEGVHEFRGFPPGRYRLQDLMSGITSPPFDLVSGGGDLDVTFDLMDSVKVSGHVAVPEGERAAFANVRIQGRESGSVSSSNPVGVGADGSFEFRARRGDRHHLVVDHPTLRQDASTGEFVVGESDPVLRLVTGPQVVFRIEGMDATSQDPDPRVSGPLLGALRVRLMKDGRGGVASTWAQAIATDGAFRFAVPMPGIWSIAVTRAGFPPLLLEDVSVEQGRTDLGTLVFGKGASLELRLLKGKGAIPRRLSVRAKHTGELPYTASAHEIQAGDPPFIHVEGLGVGTFEVVVSPMLPAQGPPLLEQEIHSDGSTPIVLDLQLP